jgi:hypothetical protein
MKKNKHGKFNMNRHHLKAKANGGQATVQNLLWIYKERHEMWHILFANLSIDEVIELLIRVSRAKKNQKIYHSCSGK